MAHNIVPFQLFSAILFAVLSGSVVFALYRRKKSTGIKALNLLIYLFTSLCILGIFELLSILFHDQIVLFGNQLFVDDDVTRPIILNPVRLANLAGIIVLFFFADSIMAVRSNIYRLVGLFSLLSMMILVGVLSAGLNNFISTNVLFSFANNTRLEEFIFDILQLYVIGFVMYMWFKQYQFTDSEKYKKYLRLLMIATILLFSAILIETAEHFINGVEVDAFLTGLPTIALLAYVYLRYPNMVYLVPTNVRFLQLIGLESGIPIYSAEFRQNENSKMDFLVGPSLSSIRSMLRELLNDPNHPNQDFSLRSFSYSNGYLVFKEKVGVFAFLQTERLSRVLLNSLEYFITEFEAVFGDQLHPFKGEIISTNGITPDDLLRRCMPVVQATPVISSVEAHSK